MWMHATDDQKGCIDAEILFFFSWTDESLRQSRGARGGEASSRMSDIVRNQPDWSTVWMPVLMCPNVRESIGVEAVCRPFDKRALFNSNNGRALEFNLTHGGLGYRQDSPFLVDPRDGVVVLERRLTYRFGCNFDMKYFPFDTQALEIVIIELEHTGGIQFVPAPPPFERNNTVSSFARDNLVDSWELHYPTEVFDEANAFIAQTAAQYKLQINVRRRSLFYVVYVMFPFGIICASALLGFALPVDQLDERLAAVMGSFLTAVTFHLSAGSSPPSVPYMSIMGIFVVVGFVLIFLVALYFTQVMCFPSDLRETIDYRARWLAVVVMGLYFSITLVYCCYVRHCNIENMKKTDRGWRGRRTLRWDAPLAADGPPLAGDEPNRRG